MTKAIVVPWAGDGPLKALPRLVDIGENFESVAKGLWCEYFDPKSKRYGRCIGRIGLAPASVT